MVPGLFCINFKENICRETIFSLHLSSYILNLESSLDMNILSNVHVGNFFNMVTDVLVINCYRNTGTGHENAGTCRLNLE